MLRRKRRNTLNEFQITAKGKKVFADDTPLKQLSEWDAEDNLVFFWTGEPEPEQQDGKMRIKLFPDGAFWCYFMDSNESAQRMKNQEFDLLMFPFCRWSAPIEDVWKKAYQKGFKGAEHIIAMCDGSYTSEEGLYINKLSVRKGYRQNGIGTKIVNALRKQFPKNKKVTVTPTTQQGQEFFSKYAHVPKEKISREGDAKGNTEFDSNMKNPKIIHAESIAFVLEALEKSVVGEEKLHSIDVNALKKAAKTIKHCGDYGQLFVHTTKPYVFWICGDSDGSNYYSRSERKSKKLTENDPEYTHTEKEVKAILSKVKGVKKVEVEAEAGPYNDPEWKRIKY